jgi:hypothetical protein
MKLGKAYYFWLGYTIFCYLIIPTAIILYFSTDYIRHLSGFLHLLWGAPAGILWGHHELRQERKKLEDKLVQFLTSSPEASKASLQGKK